MTTRGKLTYVHKRVMYFVPQGEFSGLFERKVEPNGGKGERDGVQSVLVRTSCTQGRRGERERDRFISRKILKFISLSRGPAVCKLICILRGLFVEKQK